MRNFKTMLESQWSRGHFLCVGLDTDPRKIPRAAHKASSVLEAGFDHIETIVAFNKTIIDVTHDLVCAYKIDIAFYEAYGPDGLLALRRTINHIHRVAPDVPVILDANRGGLGNANEGYAQLAFNLMKVDAITVNPYLGSAALRPFLERADKGIFVLCRTSNPGAGEFQDLRINGDPLYRRVARQIVNTWNDLDNCGLVVDASYPAELATVRAVARDIPILIPNNGIQGDHLGQILKAGKDKYGKGIIINVSHSIIFASTSSNFAEVSRQKTKNINDQISEHLKGV